MKRLSGVWLYAAVAATFFTWVTTRAQGGSSDLSFETDTWDFGTIKEADGPVSHTFTFVNKGSRPVVIERVAVSCGCTTPSYSRQPIRPGGSSTVKITFDPAGRPGRFNKSVNILSGSGRNRNVLKLKGVVEPRPHSVEEDYPVEIAAGLRSDMLHRGFGYVSRGEIRSMTINLINTSSKTLKLDTVRGAWTGLLRVDFPRQLAAGKRATLTLTYDLPRNSPYGMFSDQVYLVVDGQKAGLPVNTTLIVVDDFTSVEPQESPVVEVSPMFYNFGENVRGRVLSKRFVMSNQGRSPLHVRAVSVQKYTETDLSAGVRLEPGESIEFEIVFSPDGLPGSPVFGGVTVITDDPDRPLREIKVGAVI